MEPTLLKLVSLAVISFFAVALMLPRFRRLAARSGFVDRPGGRKDHEAVVPPIGGLVIFPVFIILALAAGMDIGEYGPLLAALGLILVTGSLDDYMDINANLRFFIHFIAAFLIVVPGGAEIRTLGNFFGFGTLSLSWMGAPFTIFCVMLLINAFNMMDGLDGLAGGKGVIVLVWLVVAEGIGGNTGGEQIAYMVLLMGAIGGFLFSNMRTPINKKAKVFLGDSGSMALGLVAAWFCIRLSQPPAQAMPPIVVAWILSVPVIDAFALFTIRLSSGRHPFSADRLHFHHHFVHAGLSPGQATCVILIIGYLLGLAGYAGAYFGLPEYVLTYAWIMLLAIHTLITFNSVKFISFLARNFVSRV